jgi:hypothetical protein
MVMISSVKFKVDVINSIINDENINSLKTIPSNYPYCNLFSGTTGIDDYALNHIKKVVAGMYDILYNDCKKIFCSSDPEQDINRESEDYKFIRQIVSELREDNKVFLLYAALYHDIGKSKIRPRHGVEGADIIKDSKKAERDYFSGLGFKRSDLFILSDLIRFHDYLAMIGTGEVSYLIFAEVLSPISNISLSHPRCFKKFMNYLLLLNLADVAGSMPCIDGETFSVFMHDFNKIYAICNHYVDKDGDFQQEDYMAIVSKLLVLSENHAYERLRRLLRTGFSKLNNNAKDDKKLEKLRDYEIWITDKTDSFDEDNNDPMIGDHAAPCPDIQSPRSISSWFSRDYEKKRKDMVPINACLRGINVKPEFCTKFSFICKLDYFLGFIEKLFYEVVCIEIDKQEDMRKNPHDLRLDISMILVDIINMLVEEYGEFTVNNSKICLGFERFFDFPRHDKLYRRLTGADGEFKEAEALTRFRNNIALWRINP